jgi:DeoR/GlpR family transcriptional regulator of sugar metabolism
MKNESNRKQPQNSYGLFREERRQQIIRVAENQQRVTVDGLAKLFSVSPVTIRTDFAWLEQNGLIRRTHGGAVPALPQRVDIAFAAREQAQQNEKERIGLAAANLVQNGDSIALDASTTALHLARNLRGIKEITIITNGIRVAEEIANYPGLTIMLLGGLIRPTSLSVVGNWSEALIGQINIGKAFVGAKGFTLTEGLTDVDGEEVKLKQALVASAREVIAIIDHTKWGQVGLATFCPVDRIRRIITDRAAPRNLVGQTRQRGIEITLV